MLEELESLLKPSLVCFYMQIIFLALTENVVAQVYEISLLKIIPIFNTSYKTGYSFLENKSVCFNCNATMTKVVD